MAILGGYSDISEEAISCTVTTQVDVGGVVSGGGRSRSDVRKRAGSTYPLVPVRSCMSRLRSLPASAIHVQVTAADRPGREPVLPPTRVVWCKYRLNIE